MEICRERYSSISEELLNTGAPFCEATWDSALCWPPTLASEQATLSCPPIYQGVSYDINFNATRFCWDNATWAERSDYDFCVNNSLSTFQINQAGDALQGESMAPYFAHLGVLGVYYIGYGISLVSSCVALWVFLYFRTLHCLRNTLHCNLIITYILVGCTWIIMTSLVIYPPSDKSHERDKPMEELLEYVVDCRIFVAIFNYFQVTNFFWMLVEGLYIIWIIFCAHKLETLVFWPFALIGWGLPLIVVSIWIPIKVVYDNSDCWWTDITSAFNFVYIGPIFLVLLINVIFLFIIMRVLLQKYRGTVTTTESTKRTAKSFFILLPLLGITYLLLLVLPGEPGILRTVLNFVIAFFNSMQGFFVSLLYCFFNNEVRSTIRLRGNSFFPYRTWLKLDASSSRRSARSLMTYADASADPAGSMRAQRPPALSFYRQIINKTENQRQYQLNAATANRNEITYLLKEKEHQDRIQKQIRHQAMGYRTTVF